MNSSRSLEETIAVNNHGGEFLKNGNLAASLGTLQRAVALLRAFGQQKALAKRDDVVLSTIQAQPSYRFDRSHQKALGCDPYFIYDRPVFVVASTKLPHHEPVESMVIAITTAVLFNMAVVYHIKGKQTGRSLLINKARQMYDIILTIMKNIDSHDASYGVLNCLVLNNLAELDYGDGNYNASLYCLEAMRGLLTFKDSLSMYLHPKDAIEIRLNVMHRQIPSTASAA